MKLRIGFVSNSSSSSFILGGKMNTEEYDYKNVVLDMSDDKEWKFTTVKKEPDPEPKYKKCNINLRRD